MVLGVPTMTFSHREGWESCTSSMKLDVSAFLIWCWSPRRFLELLVCVGSPKLLLILAKECCSNRIDEFARWSEGSKQKGKFPPPVTFYLAAHRRCHPHLLDQDKSLTRVPGAGLHFSSLQIQSGYQPRLAIPPSHLHPLFRVCTLVSRQAYPGRTCLHCASLSFHTHLLLFLHQWQHPFTGVPGVLLHLLFLECSLPSPPREDFFHENPAQMSHVRCHRSSSHFPCRPLKMSTAATLPSDIAESSSPRLGAGEVVFACFFLRKSRLLSSSSQKIKLQHISSKYQWLFLKVGESGL